MSQLIDKKYENLFFGYKNESIYRKNIVENIKNTRYKDLKEICSKIEYGLSDYDVIRLAEAYTTANKSLRDKIEYILTDINYHSECSELIRGHADEIIREKKESILNAIKNEVVDIFEKNLNNNRYSFEISSNSNLLKDYSILELEYLEDQGILKQTNKVSHTFKLSQDNLDCYLEKKWEELTDILFKEINNEQILNEDYWDFDKGVTTNEDIWHYFDENYSKGVSNLLYENYKEPLKITNDLNELIKIFEDEYYEDKESNGFIPINSSLIEKWKIQDLDYLVEKNILQVRNCEGLAYELTDEYISKLEKSAIEENEEEEM